MSAVGCLEAWDGLQETRDEVVAALFSAGMMGLDGLPDDGGGET